MHYEYLWLSVRWQIANKIHRNHGPKSLIWFLYILYITILWPGFMVMLTPLYTADVRRGIPMLYCTGELIPLREAHDCVKWSWNSVNTHEKLLLGKVFSRFRCDASCPRNNPNSRCESSTNEIVTRKVGEEKECELALILHRSQWHQTWSQCGTKISREQHS